MKNILLLLMSLLLHEICFAQGAVITGKITGRDNEPVVNASVQIKGTSRGAVTNEKGVFTLTVAPDGVLLISSMGYKPKEVPVAGARTLNIRLESSNRQLDDIVVLGYQRASRKSVSTSISSISSKDIEAYNAGTVATAMQGKLPGVQVMAAEGLPGAQPRILVRGLSSIMGNTNPLVIVDGMEIGYNNMNTINPLDILSIDVLKDAAAASIYGARSGQGVILITTKRGKGAPVIAFSASSGITRVPNIKMADAREYATVMNKIATNDGAATLPFPDLSQLSSHNYWDEAFGQGSRQDYNISVTGGTDRLSLMGSLGYYTETSYAGKEGGQWKKITGRLNADWEISKVFKAGMNIAPRYESYPYAPINVTWQAFAMDPTTKPYRSEEEVYASLPQLSGEFADFMTAFNPYYSLPGRSLYNGLISPQFNLRTNFDKREYFGGQFGAYLEARPIKGLVLKSVLDATANFSQQNTYAPKYYFASNAYRAKSQVASNTANDSRMKITNTADYTFNIKRHNVNVLLGQSYDNFTMKGTSASRENIPFDADPYRYLNSGTLVTDGSGTYQEGASTTLQPFGRMLSFFGSLRYNYREKYYLAGTMRADASSLINPLYRWGYFPSVSGAWVASQEPFMEPLRNTLSYLKLRASWGKSGGNLPTTVAAYVSTVGATTYVDATGKPIYGYATDNIANSELKWEVQEDYTLGLDATLFDKLNLSVERYERRPNNLLVFVRIDPILGYPQNYPASQLVNAGRMTTRGWDISIGYKDNITPKFRYGADLTLSTFKSKAGYLASADPIIGGEANEVISTFRSRTTKGHAPGAWWGYIADGVFQTDAEAAAYVNKAGERLQPKATAGDLKFRDINGDGKLDNSDLTDLGAPYPKLTAGLAITLNYGNFDFRTDLYGVFGQQNFNNYRRNMVPGPHYNFLSGFADQFWDGPGSTNKFPILRTADQNGNFTKMSTFFLEKGNFVRCNLMQLGYTLPSGLVKGIKSCRISVSAQNLFTITKYSGLNPDVPWYSTISYNGLDNYQMLLPRSYLLGLNLVL